jgi:EAL domain-containing protein (putative c-di-GMP-specific phosphodiesterase class I)
MHPEHFIPLAEETGLIVPLTRWILREACSQNRAWQKQGLPAMRIAVNLSARQFADENLLGDVAGTLHDIGMDPTLLELEITESMMMHDTGKTIQVLAGLKAMGVHIAIDDFGIGYSSLSHLKQFPIDIIKIDRSFITDIPGNQADEAITDAIIAMGKSLKILVVAEGVEALEQLQFLRSRGCDEVQGYFFSRPIPADDFTKLLRKNLASPALPLVAGGSATNGSAQLTGGVFSSATNGSVTVGNAAPELTGNAQPINGSVIAGNMTAGNATPSHLPALADRSLNKKITSI